MPGKSNRQKGNEFQREIMIYLIKEGWTVHNQTPGGRYNKNRDIFGCDLIAKKMNKTLWIQATIDSHKTRKLEEILRFPWSTSDDVQVWMKRKGGSISIFGVNMEMNSLEIIGVLIRGELHCAEGVVYGY